MASQESTTPDLVALWQRGVEAHSRGDFDAPMSMWADDAVWESPVTLGVRVEGVWAVRRFLEDFRRSYEVYEQTMEGGRDLGNGVLFVVSRQDARLVGGSAILQESWAVTRLCRAGLIERVVASRDIDEARAAAERLAHEWADD